MEYEVYEDPGAGWAWRGIDNGTTIIISTGHNTEFEAKRQLAEHDFEGYLNVLAKEVIKENTMQQKFRLLIIISLTITAFITAFFTFKSLVQPLEPVWNEDATVIPDVPLAVDVGPDFAKPAEYGIALWNDIMPKGKPLFIFAPVSVEFGGVRIVGDDRLAQPCGTLGFDRPEREDGHSAVSYQCKDGIWEIHIFESGDLHTQFCIIAHELGHILGLADDHRGKRIMNQYYCSEEQVLPSDKDKAAVIERFIKGR